MPAPKFLTQREKLTFENSNGIQLAAMLERPKTKPLAYALFAHCFTCSKNISAASNISKTLAEQGFAVLRFDFTGLGNSDGDFANTHFSSNIQDLLSAAAFLKAHYQSPSLLIGHSLGGAAVLAAAAQLPDIKAVVTIGAPANPEHVTHLFDSQHSEIQNKGYATVTLAGRKFTIKKQFLQDIEQQHLSHIIQQLRCALMIMHSPVDDIVSIDQAALIYKNAKHPKNFISLDQADHLLSKSADSEYAATVIASWSKRYLLKSENTPTSQRPKLTEGEVWVSEQENHLTQAVLTDSHYLLADEPSHLGGNNLGPSPYEWLLAALGSCTAMTLRMYARHKQLDLGQINVRLKHAKIYAKDCQDCETQEGKVDFIERIIEINPDVTSALKNKILEIADKCPVHRTLTSEIKISTKLKKQTHS